MSTTDNNTTTKSVGTALIISTIRIIILSVSPPKYPDIEPYTIPIITTKVADTIPIKSEILAPIMHLTSKSLPKVSVPNGCSKVGRLFSTPLFI